MSVLAAVAPLQWGDVLVRLGVDLAAIAALAYGVYFRRHGRRDLFVIYAMFNVGLFLALVVMTAGEVGVGVGFGLFAVLSIVRLLEVVFADEDALRRHVEERLNADVAELTVLELDYVREITRVAARYVPRPRLAPAPGKEALDDGPVGVGDR